MLTRNLEEPRTDAERDAAARSPFAPEVWLLTRYDDGVAMLLDDERFAVDPLTALTTEQRTAMRGRPSFYPCPARC